MKCRYCEYDWLARVKEPKACPRCKNRLDYARNRTVKASDARKMMREIN